MESEGRVLEKFLQPGTQCRKILQLILCASVSTLLFFFSGAMFHSCSQGLRAKGTKTHNSEYLFIMSANAVP
jgi:hypothetical protein